MVTLFKAWCIAFLPVIWYQGIVQGPVQARFTEAVSTASAEGLAVFIGKLDSIASAYPNSPLNSQIQETVQLVGLLHPGSVPDAAERMESLATRSKEDPSLASAVRRVEILRRYYEAAIAGRGESLVGALEDPVFENSLLALHALADASLRRGDYGEAEQNCRRLIESDPYSPLIADVYVILGLCSTYRGEPGRAARNLQKALLITEHPTLYGRTQDYLAATYRFVRPVPGKVGKIFDEVEVIPISGTRIKDPQTLTSSGEEFILVDREQIVSISQDGKAVERKPGRKFRDSAPQESSTLWSLTDELLDPGTGSPIRLTVVARRKAKQLKKMRSMAIDDRGDFYLLDEDAGLLHGEFDESGNPSLTVLAPIKGRFARLDRRGYLYILAWDRRSISIHSRDGKPIARIMPSAPGGKASVAAFALDSLNHIYILEEKSSSVQVFAVNDDAGELDAVRIGTIPLEARQQFEDLKVMAVSDRGELALTGKNKDTWIIFK